MVGNNVALKKVEERIYEIMKQTQKSQKKNGWKDIRKRNDPKNKEIAC